MRNDMSYINAETLLPPELVKEIQNYVQGSLVYIPTCGESRLGWGHKNGTRLELDRRNESIRAAKAAGRSVRDLADEYGISTDGIRKILARAKCA
jgi:hypothetical protein